MRARLCDTRPTCASKLDATGATVKQIQEQLGHTDPSTTLRMYVHTTPDQLSEASERVSKAVLG
jgi:integrase